MNELDSFICMPAESWQWNGAVQMEKAFRIHTSPHSLHVRALNKAGNHGPAPGVNDPCAITDKTLHLIVASNCNKQKLSLFLSGSTLRFKNRPTVSVQPQCPANPVDNQVITLRQGHIIRMAKRGVEDTALASGTCPGNRVAEIFRFIISIRNFCN